MFEPGLSTWPVKTFAEHRPGLGPDDGGFDLDQPPEIGQTRDAA